ncbi:MAG: hypothetical protein K0S39_3101 [Paenibacillus sp.]|nr:hypothetical protein [Paenibacillus sp.]
MIRDLLLQLLTVLFPIMVTQLLILDKLYSHGSRRHQYLIGLLSGASAILCMSYPVYLEPGFIWDSRWAPLTAAILYGGYRAGGIAVTMSLVYRWLIGGEAVYFAVIGNALIAVVPFLLVSRFCERSQRQRYLTAFMLSMSSIQIIILAFSYLAYRDRMDLVEAYQFLLAGSALIQVTVTMLAVFFIENALEISRIRLEAQRTEKLTIISEMAASVTHEVRNPLTVVRGFIQLAGSSVDKKVQGYLRTAIDELDRAESIISDYLNLAKPQIDKIEEIGLSGFLDNTVTLMNSYAAMQGVALQMQVEEGLYIKGDRAKLKQVIVNLIKNSIEATSSGGTIDVKSYLVKNKAVIEIIDTGKGMSKEQLKRIGSSFYTTKESGTGIGLMLAFRMIEAMEGTLDFESEKGKGTKARIRFPISANYINSQASKLG